MADLTVNEKLSQALELFLLPSYNVSSVIYLDLLLTKISETITNPKERDKEQVSILKNWLIKAAATWNSESKPCLGVTVFTLKLAGILGKNADEYDYLQAHDVFTKLIGIFNLNDDNLSASIKMGYINMLLGVLENQNRRHWIKTSGVWRDIVKFSHLHHTYYVTRQCHSFISQLLISESQNITFCTEVIEAVCAPLVNNTWDPLVHSALADPFLDQSRILSVTIEMILSIMESTLFRNADNTIPKLLVETMDLEARVKALLEACISTTFSRSIQKLWILLILNTVKCGWETNGDGETIVSVEHWDKFRLGYCYMQTLFVSKKYVVELARTNRDCFIYWKKLQAVKPFKLLETAHQFEHQIVALMVAPLFICLRRNYVKHDLFEMFMDKMFNITCQPILRLIYETRDVMLREELDVESTCKSCIDLMLEIVDIMSRDTAVIAFQSMCHVLKNYMQIEGCGKMNEPEPMIADDAAESPILLSALLHGCENYHEGQRPRPTIHQRNEYPKSILDGDPIVECPILLSRLLVGLAAMTEKFQFTWSDCVETICVLSLAQGILNHTGTLPDICIKALKLAKIAIENFMPPNLALLVNSESHMNNVGRTLYKRLHDPCWGVRDSALEVLHVIARISETTYPAFQELLITEQLIPLILDIALKDGESYVRASALKFIAITIRINNLWDRELYRLDLFEKAKNLFNTESEAIVRKEAVELIKELYVHRKWPKTALDTINNIMTEAAVIDLHWEVKINALEYWRHLITVGFNDRGMLDGEFPSVTFSKEHRKIVTLDEKEIKSLINKALDVMAKQNCLGVLLLTLEDESDFEVSKCAADIIRDLKNLLLKYNIDKPITEEHILPENSSTLDTPYVKSHYTSSNTNCKENNSTNDLSHVIDDIVDANDDALLASIYRDTLKMNEDDKSEKQNVLTRISTVTKEQFLGKILNTDIDAYIDSRCKWLRNYTSSFDSALDDILTVYKYNNINSMDCY